MTKTLPNVGPRWDDLGNELPPYVHCLLTTRHYINPRTGKTEDRKSRRYRLARQIEAVHYTGGIYETLEEALKARVSFVRDTNHCVSSGLLPALSPVKAYPINRRSASNGK
jgi:hypothetical protein